ncbi:MAG: NADPH-dependent 7-cyano-7-deazaguanine reductase QueF [Candidatus Dadabacteria bacterium]|nr:NADPH-dependent 7-cyano-7-deazaguanine reductase QueF [Candidatus Dadabacteria bacterium]
MSTLETFPNSHQDRDYEIEITCPEFTCVCPRTGQPDFATICIKYVPDELCIELKSLKLYMFSYRDKGQFHESVTNAILDDIVAACRPRRAEIVGDFNVRGGIKTVVRATYSKTGEP